ncbi:MAG: AAA family ATPase [SAR324 cluster bacterium]|nr:AAA family ATPase [SAR324 cluster bacterium]
MKIIASYNIKGGVGKTATIVNLAYLAAADGHKVLLCDLDPQGSATFYFRIRTHKKQTGQKLLRGRKKLDKFVMESDFENLEILPANLSYRSLDILLNKETKSKHILKNIFKSYQKTYDLILLDCPPNITLLSENIFYAADLILVPIIPSTLSIRTYDQLLDFFKQEKIKRSKLIPFLSMVEKRKKLHTEITEDLLNHDKHFLRSMIPYSANIEKMGINRKPIAAEIRSTAAKQAYLDLWQEVTELLQ